MATIRELRDLIEKIAGDKLTESDKKKLVDHLQAAAIKKTGEEQFLGLDKKQIDDALGALEKLKQTSKERYETNLKTLKLIGEEGDETRRRLKFEEEKLTLQLKELEYLSRAADKDEKRIEDLTEQIKAQEKLIKLEEKRLEITEKALGFGEDLTDRFAELFGVTDKGFAGLLTQANRAGNTVDMLGQVTKGMVSRFKALASPTIMLASFATKALEATLSVDKLNAELFRTTGMEDAGFLVGEIGAEMRSLDMDSEELSSSIVDLQRNFKGFFDLTKESQKELSTTAALMNQLGVDSGVTAESMGFLMSSLGMTTQRAAQINRELVATANALKLPPEEIISGFSAARDSLAKFGPGMVTEFKRLAGASRALNMDVGSLTGIVGEQLDTFEGAANAAGDLNAMLGGPFLNSVELLNATESERVMMLKDTLDLQGRSFDEMSRFERKGIAKSLGMSVNELGKFMNASASEMQSLMDEAAKEPELTQEEMTKNIMRNLDVMTSLGKELKQVFESIFVNLFGGGNTQNALNNFKDTFAGIGETISSLAKFMGGTGGKVLMGLFGGLAGAGLVRGLMGKAGGLLGLGEEDVQKVEVVNDEEVADNLSGTFGKIMEKLGPKLAGLKTGIAGAASAAAGKMGALFGGAKAALAAAAAPVAAGAAGAAAGLGIGSLIYNKFVKEEDDLSAFDEVRSLFAGGTQRKGVRGGEFAAMSAAEQANIKASSPMLRVDDFSSSAAEMMMAMANVKPNSSDQIVAAKEGGVLDKKLDKMIELLKNNANGGGKKEIVLKVNNKELARTVIGSINNDYYNMRT